jgi:hypothetical protein
MPTRVLYLDHLAVSAPERSSVDLAGPPSSDLPAGAGADRADHALRSRTCLLAPTQIRSSLKPRNNCYVIRGQAGGTHVGFYREGEKG